MTSPRILVAALAAGAFSFVACSAGSTDFKEAAEKAITSEDGGLGKGSSASCEKPGSTDVGTTFECTGTGPDGTVYAITATIDKKDHVQVESTGIVSGDGTGDTGEVTDTTLGS